ncbi:uncharacterized protein VTP21DRAFT_4812 [Calcarisporiella thermophila]|uniref:uncharacterized protein n=1 Tax=Calcarisporiella thermophila TaxID=911321 RepID=UPI0037438958
MSKAPEVVVFNDPTAKKNASGGSKTDYRAFLSSKISKLKPPAPAKPKTQKEMEEEQVNKEKDRELQDLLKTTRLLEEYSAEQLSGKDLRKYKEQKLVELGAKPSKGPKMPIQIALGMREKQRERHSKKLQEAKNLGLYHSSIKHLYSDNDKSSEKSGAPRKNRGMKMAMGKFKDGVLKLSQKDIMSVRNEGSKVSKGKRKKK